MKLRFLLRLRALFFFQILFFTATAQTHPITGTVLSKTTGQPLSGATITIKGTRSSTFTDNAGNFKIEVSEKARALTISYVGMNPQELAIPISGVLSILLVQATGSSLDEVVVVGYGTQRKSVVTGAISSVRSSDLESQPVIRVEQSLQGRTSD